MDKKVLQAIVEITAYDRMTRVIDQAVNSSIRKMNDLQKASNRLAKDAMDFGKSQIATGIAAGAALYAPVKEAIEFESKMTDIRKVVNGLQDDAALAQMGEDIKRLAREVPVSTGQLQELVAAGGRMDVPREQLIGYTREVSKMAIAFEMSAGIVGEQMGKISKLFDVPLNRVNELADAINYLDDNSIAKGADIMDVLLRSGATAKQAGLTAQQNTALASTFLTLGSRADVAGTSINALVRELSIATMQPKRFQNGLEALGLSASKLQKDMSIKPQETILKVLDMINKMPKSKQLEVTTQLFGKEYGDDITKLAQGVEEYRRQLKLLEDQQLKGSMDREFQYRTKTTAAQLQMLSNQVTELAVDFGTSLLPIIKELITAFKPMLDSINEFVKANPGASAAIGKLVAGFAAFNIVTGVGSFVFGGFMKVVANWAAISGFALKAIQAVRFGMFALRYTLVTSVIPAIVTFGKVLLASPITWYVGAAVALGAAVYYIYRNWGPISEFFKRMWASVKAAFVDAWNAIKGFLTRSWNWLQENWKLVLIGLVNPVAGVGMLIVQAIKNFFPEFYNAGVNIIQSIIDGIKNKANELVGEVRDLAKKMRDFFPFSPAKTGPLRDIHKLKFVETIAQSIKPAPMLKAMGTLTGSMASYKPQFAMAGNSGGSVSINYSPTINLSGTLQQAEEKFADMLEKHKSDLVRILNREQQRTSRRQF